jgi:hypothetical protein
MQDLFPLPGVIANALDNAVINRSFFLVPARILFENFYRKTR